MTEKHYFFSIGASCLPKFGLDLLQSSQPTFFFDWLISDVNSLRNSLLEFNEDQFLIEYSLCDANIRIIDHHTRLRFQHELPFLKNPSRDIITSRKNIDEQIAQLRLKYLRRRARFMDVISSCNSPVLIRYAHDRKLLNKSQADIYASEIYEIIKALNLRTPRLLVLSKDIDSVLIKYGGLVVVHPILVDDQSPWQPIPVSMAKAMSLIAR